MTKKSEERTAARDFLLARLAICRGALAAANAALDDALMLFLDPTEDSRGKDRSALLETVDGAIGDAARAVQAAMPALADIDPKEEEPEDDDDDEEDEDEDDEPDDD